MSFNICCIGYFLIRVGIIITPGRLKRRLKCGFCHANKVGMGMYLLVARTKVLSLYVPREREVKWNFSCSDTCLSPVTYTREFPFYLPKLPPPCGGRWATAISLAGQVKLIEYFFP
jgi:hypothetical protein